ncbi:MAG: polysaccharide deacetylase family protein [Eubacteriales bacterium]|nr:polysaccharide deacetylase family protein [Eubacteriales bacterium]
MARGRRKKARFSPAQLAAAAGALLLLIVLLSLLIARPWASAPDPVDPQPTPAPTAQPEQTPSPSGQETAPPESATESGLLKPAPVETAGAILPKIAKGYLPVFAGAATEKKQIAITVDDLWQHENVEQILEVCAQTGARLTFFPIGEAVQGNPELLRRIHEGGHEIENHTMNHVNLYALTAEEMTEQLLAQNRLVSEALGVDYQMHFLRPRGGNADYDKRMHNMLQQLGYVGVSHWSLSGTPEMSTWTSKLKSGDVLLFHSTDADLKKLVKLIPKLTEVGYELVTLNELYSLPDNAEYPLGSTTIGTTEGLDFAAMEADVPYTTLQTGDTSYAVRRMQLRLAELGFYTSECDGDYGSGTAAAVQAFQAAAGLDADGICGTATQDVLFSDAAPRAQ